MKNIENGKESTKNFHIKFFFDKRAFRKKMIIFRLFFLFENKFFLLTIHKGRFRLFEMLLGSNFV